MELTQRSRTAKRAVLLASTAIIALLSACQDSGGGAPGPSSTVSAGSSEDHKVPAGGSGY